VLDPRERGCARLPFAAVRTSRLTFFIALLALVLFGACGGDDDSSSEGSGDDTSTTAAEAAEPEITQVAVEAKEYSYSAPSSIKGGLVEFTMKNVGKELHIAAIAKIDDGKTFSDAAKDLQSPTPPADPASEEVGGIASTSPTLSSNVLIALEPGSYYFACFIPAADGQPHVAKGMVLPFEVTEAEGEADAPTEAGTVTAKDFSYETAYKVAPGEQIIELDNQGGQGHEITLLEFAAGKGPADLQAYFAKPEGELPATFYGGPFVKKGAKALWKTPKMEAGKSYFFMCLIPDPADGVPHAAKGMVLPVQIT
jgi:hypothetical protein